MVKASSLCSRDGRQRNGRMARKRANWRRCADKKICASLVLAREHCFRRRETTKRVCGGRRDRKRRDIGTAVTSTRGTLSRRFYLTPPRRVCTNVGICVQARRHNNTFIWVLSAMNISRSTTLFVITSITFSSRALSLRGHFCVCNNVRVRAQNRQLGASQRSCAVYAAAIWRHGLGAS